MTVDLHYGIGSAVKATEEYGEITTSSELGGDTWLNVPMPSSGRVIERSLRGGKTTYPRGSIPVYSGGWTVWIVQDSDD